MNLSTHPHNILHRVTAGLVCNERSKFTIKNDLIYLSYNSYINIYNLITKELVETYKIRNKQITALNIINNILLIGYKDGILLGYKNGEKRFSLRLLNKISHIVPIDEDKFVFTSSNRLFLYDINEESIIREYKEIGSTYSKVVWHNNKIVCVGNNNAVYIYSVENIYADFIKSFEKNIIDILHKNNAIILFFSEKIIELNLETFEEKLLFSMKNMSEIYLLNSNILIRKKNTLYEYKYGSFSLINKISVDFKYSRMIPYDNEMIFLLSTNTIYFYDNKLTELKREISFHKNPIFNIFTDKNLIVTVSSDCAIIWEYTDRLELRNKIILNITSAYYYKNYLYLRVNNRLLQYDIHSVDIINNIVGNGSSKMITFENYLVEYSENLCYVYDIENGSKIEMINASSEIICCAIFGNMIALSLMDNQIELYNIMTGELKRRIYGHSLPTRYMEFSLDGKRLLSSGCDKLVKMWGTEHGEIQKTFLSNSFSTKFIENDLFISCEEEQFRYYKNYEEIHLFAECNSKVIARSGNSLIFGNYGLSIYEIDEVPFSLDDNEIYTELEIENRDKLNEFFLALDSKDSNLLNIILQFSKFEFKILIEYMKLDSLNFLIELVRNTELSNIIKMADLFIVLSIKYKEVGGNFIDIKDIYEGIKSRIIEEKNRLEEIN